MATPITDILQWFLTGKKPTQAQFEATFRSFWQKDEVIPTAKVQDLDSTLSQKAEKSQFTTHLTDPDAHAAEFAKVYTPYRFITFLPIANTTEIILPQLVDAEFDGMMYRGQGVDPEELTYDAVTGTLSNWDFKVGVKYIIFYTKL